MYLPSAGTHHGNLLKLLMTRSRVTCFIPQAHTRKLTVLASKGRERTWKNEGEWTRKVEIRTKKKFLAVGEACVAIF